MPDDPKFHFARAGCTQWLNLPDGDILLADLFLSQGSGRSELCYGLAMLIRRGDADLQRARQRVDR